MHAAASQGKPDTDADSTATVTSTEAAAARAQPPKAQLPDRIAALQVPCEETKEQVTITARPYKKMGIVGKGGSCKVYRVLSKGETIYALKRVKGTDAHLARPLARCLCLNCIFKKQLCRD
jgi:hypothetical protein